MAGAECQGDIGAEAMPRHDSPWIALRVEDTRKVSAPFGHSNAAAVKRGPLAPEVDPEEIPRILEGRPGHELRPSGHVAGDPVEQDEHLPQGARLPEPIGDGRGVRRGQGAQAVQQLPYS
jgi:hypothetical protein